MLVAGSAVCLVLGTALVSLSLPGAALEADAIAARQAQAEWRAQWSRDVINRKPWNGVRMPADAPGTPLDTGMLVIGVAALAGAAAFGVARVRRR